MRASDALVLRLIPRLDALLRRVNEINQAGAETSLNRATKEEPRLILPTLR
jgi:hypothetical protein